ncbi:MAG: hypothetical protein ACYCS8_12755 [Acidithiobacillus sp.]
MVRLDEMANSVNVARGVSAVVLENFQKISLARKRLWTWSQITAAIVDEHPDIRPTESAVQSAFKRIERGIQTKRVKPLVRGLPEVAPKKAQSGGVARVQPAPVVQKPSAARDGKDGKDGEKTDWTALANGSKSQNVDDLPWIG